MGGLNNFQQYFTAIQKIESESELNIFLSKNQKQIAESFSKAIRLVWSEYEAEQIHQQVWPKVERVTKDIKLRDQLYNCT